MPRHSPGEHQRAAAIVMSYFHPWTLRVDDADSHVKHASCLRAEDQNWQDALRFWLNGNVLCQEAKQYVGNFLSVHRMRPRDDDSDDGNSQDIVSDEELEISRSSLKDALTTRVGGKDKEGTATEDAGPSHFENSVAAIEKNQEIWGSTFINEDAQIPSFVEPQALNDILKAAKKSQKREHMHKEGTPTEAESNPTLRQLVGATAHRVQLWLNKKKRERNNEGKLVVNAEQYQALRKVALRVMDELRHAADGTLDFGEPLRWLIHGGPGTGKSHVIKQIKELFTEVLHWDMGVQYQVVALQAVMADLLGGDTIHHACGIPVFGRGGAAGNDAQRQMDVAKRVLQWRWLIIDEISMVSAKLLAEIDVKLRSAVREIGTQKRDATMTDRPFGGLNVLLRGDFWQLAPPDG